MADIKAMVVIGHDSGLPEDVTVNTWAFGNVNIATPDHLDEITQALDDFYNDDTTAGDSISSYFAKELQAGATVKYYNLASPEPRAPLRTETFTLNTPGAGNSLPAEVALCMSFQGVQVSGLPQARRRGRVFLGPWRGNTNDVIDGAGNPGTVLRAVIAEQGDGLLDVSNSSLWYWAVYSPTNNNVVTINNGWVDNAWDTQRRRGTAPTARTTFTT